MLPHLKCDIQCMSGDLRTATQPSHVARIFGMPPPPSFPMETGDKEGIAKPVKKFTWKELSLLNTPENAHVAVRGKVYDVSGFVARHPGGMEQIMMGAGRDVTQLFESYHSFSVSKVLEKYYVGELVDNELPVFPKRSEFYFELRRRVEKYFKDNNIDPKIDYWMFLRYFMFLLVANLGWYGTIRYHDNYFMALPSAVVWGMFTALVAMTCTHDASHFAITHKPWVWKLVGSIHDFYQGASMYVWIHQHVLGHHPYTNIDGADPDIATAAPEVPDVRRIKWGQKWLPRYFYQHIYIPMLYCALGLKTRLQDFVILWRMKKKTIRLNRPFLNQYVIFFCGKLTHVVHRVVIPAMFMPWYTLVLVNVVAEILGSYWLALIFQTSHVISEVEWPKPDKDNVIDMDWAELQIATTQDYATGSWFWTMFTGALNHQTTHHLFPGVIQSHYPKITPIVQQTCRDFGIKYHYVDTTTEALACHIDHLRTLGQTKSSKLD